MPPSAKGLVEEQFEEDRHGGKTSVAPSLPFVTRMQLPLQPIP
jgi:hypothetical protein